jgi:broad specificity phosphatase PhoE
MVLRGHLGRADLVMAQRLILIRHGAIGAKRRGRFIGSCDVPLSRAGQAQAERLIGLPGLMGRLDQAHFYVSPQKRARQTAQAVLGRRGGEMVIDARLREIDFGQWEGLSFEEARADHPRLVGLWAKGGLSFAFPGGERLRDFARRVRGVGREMARDPAETVVAFTHAGVIRYLVCHYLGFTFKRSVLFQIDYASVTTFHLFEGKGVLTGLNVLPRRRC